MKKLRDIRCTTKYSIKSSIQLSPQKLARVRSLLNGCFVSTSQNGMACKRMRCSDDWLMLRMGIALRILINITQIVPRDVWVIQRSELDQACKAIKTRS